MVYVVQEDPNKNISPAMKFGKIVPLISSTSQIAFSAGIVAQELMQRMSNFNDDDYLLLIGDPVLIGISTAVAAHWNNGKVKMLKWDRQEKQYIPVQFNLYQQKGERGNGTEKEEFGK